MREFHCTLSIIIIEYYHVRVSCISQCTLHIFSSYKHLLHKLKRKIYFLLICNGWVGDGKEIVV